jgi:hypothetical protein
MADKVTQVTNIRHNKREYKPGMIIPDLTEEQRQDLLNKGLIEIVEDDAKTQQPGDEPTEEDQPKPHKGRSTAAKKAAE